MQQKKVAKYSLREPGGYVTPLVVQSYGRQYSAAHTLLNLLGRLGADSGRVRKGAWLEGALRRLSIFPGRRGVTPAPRL